MKDEKLISVVGINLKDKVEEILEHWNDAGRCARAELYGIADSLGDKDAKKVVLDFLKNNPVDGFTVQFALKNNLSIEEAQVLVEDAINAARRWFEKEVEEK